MSRHRYARDAPGRWDRSRHSHNDWPRRRPSRRGGISQLNASLDQTAQELDGRYFLANGADSRRAGMRSNWTEATKCRETEGKRITSRERHDDTATSRHAFSTPAAATTDRSRWPRTRTPTRCLECPVQHRCSGRAYLSAPSHGHLPTPHQAAPGFPRRPHHHRLIFACTPYPPCSPPQPPILPR